MSKRIKMSEIDVSKCEDFEKATCFDNDFDEIEFDYCKLFDEPCEDVRNNNRCTYKLKQQIQQLKQENEELREKLQLKHKPTEIVVNRMRKAEQKLERIKERCNKYKTCRIVLKEDILQIIEESQNEK